MSICIMDVEGAFLEADLPDLIFMRLSKDVMDVLRKLQPDVPRHGLYMYVVLYLIICYTSGDAVSNELVKRLNSQFRP